MNRHSFSFFGTELHALGTGGLWWPKERLLMVSDLHLGKSERLARRGGALLPPYETSDTLTRLDAAIEATAPATVVCLGDSFDDTIAAQALAEEHVLWLSRLQAGRRWIWISGNHDAGPLGLAGEHRAESRIGSLTLRHIANAREKAEISGHYHPKIALYLKGRTISRPAFLVDSARILMPAFGTFTGGLRATSAELQSLMGADAMAILTGPTPCMIPMPRENRGARHVLP